jgi:hypothetical protein
MGVVHQKFQAVTDIHVDEIYLLCCILGSTLSIPITATCGFCFNPLTDEVKLAGVLCVAYNMCL